MTRPTTPGLLRALCLAAALASLGAAPAAAQTTTVGVLNNTIAALPSCIRYELRGVCFWWRCRLFSCGIRTSFKVRHYVPDVVVSTYNDPAQHPWADIGRPVSTLLSATGSSLVGTWLDSSANVDRTRREEVSFKSVDVIGNPVGMIGAMLAGASPQLPSQFTVPGLTELMAFPSQELPNIGQAWAQVPAQLGGELVQGARRAAAAPGALLDQLAQFGRAADALGQLGRGLDAMATVGDLASRLDNLATGPLQAVGALVDMGGAGGFLCPGSASAFSLHFQSDLDGPFWRGVLPLELLYPGAWVPGVHEVSHSGLVSTWGSLYPRIGELAQVHPVKASAVFAARAASIVTQRAQPHIYTPLSPGGNMRYFETFGAPRWQMVYPQRSGCISFGENDALSLASFGDGRTTAAHGYIWNLWHRYECCERQGSYLWSVP